MSDEELLETLALNQVNGVGPRLQTLLLERFGTPGEGARRASGTELLEIPQSARSRPPISCAGRR